jgi:hypothetical protein
MAPDARPPDHSEVALQRGAVGVLLGGAARLAEGEADLTRLALDLGFASHAHRTNVADQAVHVQRAEREGRARFVVQAWRLPLLARRALDARDPPQARRCGAVERRIDGCRQILCSTFLC